MADLPPATRLALSTQYSLLSTPNHLPSGLYLLPLPSLTTWEGVLFIHRGYYQGAVLKFELFFPREWGREGGTVKVRFTTDVFHPLVDPASGQLSLAPLRLPPSTEQHFLPSLLFALKSIFKRPLLETLRESQCLNREAYRLYRNQTGVFAKLVGQSTLLSRSETVLYSALAVEDDEEEVHGRKERGIVFSRMEPDELERRRREVLGV